MSTTTKLIATAALLALLGAAHADERAAYPFGAQAAAAGAATSAAVAPAAASAIGETAAYPGVSGAAGTLTRAQVQAEVQAARRAGERVNEAGYPTLAGQVNGRSL